MPLVGVRGAAAVAQWVADVTVGANRPRELTRGRAAKGGNEGEGEGPLALAQASGGAEACWGSGVGPWMTGDWRTNRGTTSRPYHGGCGPATFGLDGLDLVPLQLQKTF